MTYVAPVDLARQAKEICDDVDAERHTAVAALLGREIGLDSLVTAVTILAQAVELLAEKETP